MQHRQTIFALIVPFKHVILSMSVLKGAFVKEISELVLKTIIINGKKVFIKKLQNLKDNHRDNLLQSRLILNF